MKLKEGRTPDQVFELMFLALDDALLGADIKPEDLGSLAGSRFRLLQRVRLAISQAEEMFDFGICEEHNTPLKRNGMCDKCFDEEFDKFYGRS